MSTIVTRSGKGSPLTNTEVDANFTNLNTDKAELSGATFSGEITANGGIALGDNDQATFGAGDDLQIYHDGSNSYIRDTGTGNLNISADQMRILNAANSEAKAIFTTDGSVELYYDNALKLATTATGIDVTGTATMDGLTVSNGTNTAVIPATSDRVDFTTASSNYINSEGSLYIKADIDLVLKGTGAEIMRLKSGKVGIGTSSPSEKLTVAGNIQIEDNDGYLQFKDTNGATNNKVRRIYNSAQALYISRRNDDESLEANDLVIDSSGSVGIGTSSPTTKLHLQTDDVGVGSGEVALKMTVPATTISAQNEIRSGVTSGTNPYMSFAVRETGTPFATVEAMRIDSSGSVGIGTSSIYGKLRLNESSGACQIYMTSENASDCAIIFGAQDDLATASLGYFHSDDSLRFNGYNNTTRMTIDSSGNVGIGTSSPDAPLHIVASTVAEMRYGAIGPSSNSALRISRNDSTTASGNPLGYLEFGGNDATSALDTSFAYVGAEASGTHAAGDNPTDLVFGTTATGSATVTERMRIDSSGSVGIGTSSFTSASAGRTVLEVNGASASALINLSVNGTRQGYIFTDTTDMNVYNVDNGSLNFGTNNAEAMRIDSSGNVLVGKTAVGMANEGIELNSGDYLGITKDSAPCAYLRRNTSDGDIIEFRKDGTTVGSISVVNGNNLTIGGAVTGHAGIQFGSDRIIPESAGTQSDALTDLGQASGRFKDLYLSGGVYLGGTGAANSLDDYEEGDYDVTITCGTSGTATVNSSFNRASYTKIGSLVTVTGLIIVSAVSSPVGNFTLNLPFTPAGLTDRAGDSSATLTMQTVVSANVSDFVGSISEGVASITVHLGDATTLQSDSAEQLTTNTQVIFSATYRAA